jgi:MFS family permease
MSAVATRGIFASSAFSRYYIGQCLSYVGDGLRTIAVPLLVYHLTGSALSTGGAFIAEVAPFAIFAVVGGSFADRTDRRRLMIACDFVRFLVMASFAALWATHHLTVPLIYTGLVVISICAAFFLGGQTSSIPFLLGKDATTRAISALVAAESTSNLITPTIGGSLFALFGPLPMLVSNAFTYLCSQFSLVLVPSLGPDRPGNAPTLRELVSDVRLGFRMLFADDAMRAQATLALMLNTLGFAGYSIVIPFLKRDFGASDTQVGIFFGIAAAGAVIGSVLAGRIDQRWPFGRTITAAYLIDAVGFLPVIFTHNLWVAASFWGLCSACATFEVSQIIGWRMRVIPQEAIGRVFGAVRLMVLAGMPPGVLAAGWLADHIGARPAMGISGIGFAIIAFFALVTPAVRNETR